jgi:mono/diheme cytochrome c family protein
MATPGDEEVIRLGSSVYAENCATCHHQNGEGNLLLFPALNGSALVTGEPPTAVIQTVLFGRREMPSFGDALSPEQLAAVISYIRNTWGNHAPVVRPEQVQQQIEAGAAGGA